MSRPPHELPRIESLQPRPAGDPLYFGTARSLQGCALRWLLGRELGPAAHQVRDGLLGTAKHKAVERVLREWTPGGTLAAARRAAGGARSVAAVAVGESFAEAAGPRFPEALVDDLRRQRAAEWREDVRRELGDLVRAVAPGAGWQPEPTAATDFLLTEPAVACTLDDGPWVGRPDVVEQHGDRVTISDVKTGAGRGEPSGDAVHADQLETYAATWACAHGGRSFVLRVCRRQGVTLERELTSADLGAKRRVLAVRGREARQRGVDKATHEGGHCVDCTVRAACPAFWESGWARQGPYRDVELDGVSLGAGETHGRARVVAAPGAPELQPGTAVELDLDRALTATLRLAEAGQRVRLTGVTVRGAPSGLPQVLRGRSPSVDRALRGAEAWLVPG